MDKTADFTMIMGDWGGRRAVINTAVSRPNVSLILPQCLLILNEVTVPLRLHKVPAAFSTKTKAIRLQPPSPHSLQPQKIPVGSAMISRSTALKSGVGGRGS